MGFIMIVAIKSEKALHLQGDRLLIVTIFDLKQWSGRLLFWLVAVVGMPGYPRVLILLTILDAAFQFGSHPTYSSVGTHPMLGGTIKYP